MPGTGFGGLLTNLFNPGLDQQIAASITPNPSPLAQQDQPKVPPVPGAPSNPAPGQAPPQVTQPDPTLAQTNQLLMQGYLASQRADSINRHIQGMAAAFGTAQQQHDAMANLNGAQGGGGGAGYLDAIGKMQGIDQQQTSQTEHARAAAGADLFAQTVFGMQPGQGNEAFNLGVMPDLTKKKMDSIFEGQTPTEQTKTYDQMHDRFIKGGGNEQDWNRFANPALIAGGIGGGLDPAQKDMQRDLMAWQANPANAGQPIPDKFTNVEKYKLSLSTDTERGKDLVESQNKFGQLNETTDTALDLMSKIATDPAAKKVLGSNITLDTMEKMPIWLREKNYGKDGAAYIANLLQANGVVYGQSFDSAGSKRTASEILALKAGKSQINNTNLSPEDFQSNALTPLITQTLRTKANNYGASGQTDSMPGYLKKYLDPIYQPGGQLYVKTTGPKAASAPDSKLKQLTTQDLSDAQTNMEKYGPKTVIQHLKDNGYDTGPLE